MCAMKRWQFWVGVAISLVFLYFVVRNINFGDFVSVLRHANYWWLIPGVAVYFVGVLGAGLALALSAEPDQGHPHPHPVAVSPRSATWATISTLRGPAKSCARCCSRRNEGVAISASLATIIVERIFDGVVMLGFVFINLAEISKLTGGSGFVGSIQQVAFYGQRGLLRGAGRLPGGGHVPREADDRRRVLRQPFRPRRFREKTMGFANSSWKAWQSLRSPNDVLMVFAHLRSDLAAGDGQILVRDARLPVPGQLLRADADERHRQPGDHAPLRPGYVGTFDAPGIAVLLAYGVPNAIASRLYPGAARRPVVPDHCPGRLLPDPRREQ